MTDAEVFRQLQRAWIEHERQCWDPNERLAYAKLCAEAGIEDSDLGYLRWCETARRLAGSRVLLERNPDVVTR